MENLPKNFDVEKLVSYCDDLVQVLKDKKGFDIVAQSSEHLKVLQSSCDADFREIQKSIEDYQKKLGDCKQKIAAAQSEASAEAETDLLQKEIDEELEKEHALKAELRAVSDEINGLECQRESIEERKLALRKAKQDSLRAEKKHSMYASVTKIIPDVNEESKISGHTVDRDKRVTQKFEFDPTKMTAYDTCNSIWSIINNS